MDQKMLEWMKNGCRLAWLIDPKTRSVPIYHLAKATRIIYSFDQDISGEEVLIGFLFQPSELR